jgi:hypothetical protein
MSGETTPLYLVCSPGRSSGRTLVSRLLTEFYVLGDRAVAAFDLCDEGPQLADYLPHLTTIADINDIRAQMRFFERLIAKKEDAKIVDVSHRTFKQFFTTVKKIRFFEEARRHSIAPLILFVDAHPRSPEIRETIQRWLPEVDLLPVRNVTERIASSGPDTPPDELTTPASLDVPLLRSSSRTLIDNPDFSFVEFWRAKPANLSDASDDELLDWLTSVFFQFQDIEVALGCTESWTQIAAPASRPVRTGHRPQRRNAQPPARRKFAPTTKVRRDVPMDLSDRPLVTMLQKTTHELQTAEDRITVFEASIKQWQDRAAQAETRLLKYIQSQIKRSES